MLGHPPQRWPNIKPTFGQRLFFCWCDPFDGSAMTGSGFTSDSDSRKLSIQIMEDYVVLSSSVSAIQSEAWELGQSVEEMCRPM